MFTEADSSSVGGEATADAKIEVPFYIENLQLSKVHFVTRE